ncbi:MULTISPECIES: LolA family protein [unclassified Acinetobacter]|uniref:LolA family protein n=1 Tax=unclassified Acinetobacter TaxID=196816 RepID=UPI0012160253|nr:MULTISPECIES: outer membrane lipoprotein carrier protein LolA [unclassified Acinetobacter]RZJ22344.1 MAG: outer membrane lipoprotein carrier protein LolA [Acinetobacter sp.]
MTSLNLPRAVWLFLASLLCLTFMLPQPVHAQNPQLRQIFGQLSATPTVRANFDQQKKLASMNKTFVSKGTVLFSKSQGVIWKIQTPVKADLIVTPRKLVQKTQRTHSQIEIDKSPYGSVATMFLQLMSGNETALAKNFNIVSASYTPAQWNVILTPKSSLFKKLFVRVDAQGQRYVDRIVLQEKANNSTTIRFSQQTTQPQTLTAEENALFQLAK